MRAVVFERNGGPEVLDYREVPDPSPRDGQVLVEVEGIGVNFRDVYEREGQDYGQKPPAIIGVEGAGRVAGTGERVAWINVPSSYAERVASDSKHLVPIPDGVSSDIAAAALLQGITAHYLAHDSYPIQKGDWVLVHAAAGGVGLLLTQIAKQLGAHVIGTTSSEGKAQLAREAGADEVLGYEDFATRAREMAGGEGVAAVYDGVGKTTFYEGLRAIRPLGRMILYGAASGQPDPLPVALLAKSGSLYVQRPTIQTYTRTPDMLRERAGKVFELIRQSKLNVRIGARYPLADARQAHIDLQARKTTGKILLEP
ncbi:MAG: quinone oxidoreductase [Chloroflexi bacterium]|nr:MAG: quinone oxidoreductase [Chloroflexota bacterium]TME51654.1 MAG: quinone oxidoreductase [Chloroflexota bacterium]